jgi:hypothetical protein
MVTETQTQIRDRLEDEIKQNKNHTDMECLYSIQLNHMIDRFKQDIMYMKNPISEKREIISRITVSLQTVDKTLQGIKREKTVFMASNQGIKDDNKMGIKDSRDRAEAQKCDIIDDIYNGYLFKEIHETQKHMRKDKEDAIEKERA